MLSFGAFLTSLRSRLEMVRGWDWTPPDPPPDPPSYTASRLQPLYETAYPQNGGALSFQEVRFDLASKVHDYAMGSAQGILLVRVPAGVGKTHALITVAQAFSEQRGRVLWAAQSHKSWRDFEGFSNFRHDLWHHWLGMMKITDDGVPVCRYAESQRRWINRGYQARDLCRALCSGDGWLEHDCPYRKQERTQAGCVFAMHNHLVKGIPIKGFKLAIVDELPLRAFTRERVIPFAGIQQTLERAHERGIAGPALDLYQALGGLMFQALGRQIDGRQLFDAIGPVLADVYAQVELGVGSALAVPPVFSEADVQDAEYYFLGDLLSAAAIGYEAWRHNWDDWAHRIWMSRAGLHILQRESLWDELPLKSIVLDATAQPDLYRLLFRTRVDLEDEGRVIWRRRAVREVYAPRVKRQGQLIQVTGRLYSKRSLFRVTKRAVIREADAERVHIEVETLPAFDEAVRTMAALATQEGAQLVGLVTYKAIEGEAAAQLEALGFSVKTQHFYNVRGSNLLQDVDVLFVLGTPTPRPVDVIKIATALDEERRDPFLAEDGGQLYRPQMTEFPITREGLFRTIIDHNWLTSTRGVGRVVNSYVDPTLATVHAQLRQAEIAQAGHRGRVNIQDIPVFILTATSLDDEPVDRILDDPPIAPDGINWRTWLHKLKPVLDRCFTDGVPVDYDLLADETDLGANYMRRKGWLQAIVDFDARWEVVTIARGRGRPRIKIAGRSD